MALCLLFSAFLAQNAYGAWYNTDWLYREKISILPSLADSDQTNFPYMVKITDSANPVFANADGDDILFTDSNGSTKLDHEIEKFDNSAGNEELVAWVRLPTLSASANTEIYMYYGNPGVSNQENAAGVWDVNFEGVWHLPEDTAGTGNVDLYKDSTLNNHHGDDYVSANGQEGKISDGQQFDGSDDYIDVSVMDPNTYDDFTISAWYKSTNAGVTDDEYIFAHKKDGAPEDQILFGPTDDAGQTDTLRLLIEINGNGNRWYYGSSDIVDQQWHYVVGVRDGNRIKLYVDGIEELDTGDMDSGVSFTIDATGGPFFGDDPGDTEQVDGNLDEVRISNIPRTEDWIEASYRNQESPGTYQTIYPEEDRPDISIDCNFSDWTNGSGTEFVIEDEGGEDDFWFPSRLDITRWGLASNLSDTFQILMGFDDNPPNNVAAITLLDTDLDDNINYGLLVMLDGVSSTVQLYSCNDTLSYGCAGATLSKTYSSPGDYCVGTGAGPWDTDTLVEIALPYADLGGFSQGDTILTSMISYWAPFWIWPRDSIFGTTGQDYDDRVQYDTDNGTGQKISRAGSPKIAGTVYSDEGITEIGAGKTVRLLVNGAEAGSDTTNTAGGFFIVAAPPINPGDAMLVYIDDDPVYQGTTTTVSGGNSLADLNIYAGHVITRQDNGGALNNADLAAARGSYSDSDILYSVDGSFSLTISGSGTELYIPTGHTFQPGGNVTTPDMKNLGRFVGGSVTVDINGTLTVSNGTFQSTSRTMTVAGDFINLGGIFSHNSGSELWFCSSH